MTQILVVCTANICRSPVVEALLRRKLRGRGLSAWRVLSSGTLGIEDWPAADSSTALMAIQGIDITAHRSSATTPDLLDASDLVICMEQAHVDSLKVLHPPAADRLHRLAELAGEPRDVSDPYGGPILEFERMVAEVDDLLERGLDRIVALADRSGKP